MRPTLTFLGVLLLAVALLAGCGGSSAPEADTTDAKPLSAKDGVPHKLSPEKCRVEWSGSKVTGKTHTGTITLREGAFIVNQNTLVGGEFVIDMSTLVVTDLQGEDKQKLEGHLRSADFFDVAKYPEARFVITDIIPVSGDTSGITHRIQGNLTMRGQTKGIDFRATIQMGTGGEGIAAKARFKIDRTHWGLAYGTDKSLKDNLISNDIEIRLDLYAD